LSTPDPPTPAGAPDAILAPYGELWLKGRNRGEFEQALIRNLRTAVKEISPVKVERGPGQILVFPERRAMEVADRMGSVFGLSALYPAWGVEPRADAIAEKAREVTARALQAFPPEGQISFRLRAKRADKSFPMISTELEQHVAESVLPDWGDRLRVNLTSADLTVGIHVRRDRAWIHAGRLDAAGGLPVGTLGHVMCLLSGGIDSPVAAWMAMKRGCDVSYVSFHSYPYLGDATRRKIARIAGGLSRWQPRTVLHVVPFTKVQEAIRDGAPEPYRTVLYRRMMQRIACRLGERVQAGGIVTGESLGQVASQTLENIGCIEEASSLPVLRPLLGFDKEETIRIARRIGTYELSILPEPDCCTVFQPTRPVIRGTVARCHEAEANLDVEALVEEAVLGTEISGQV